MMMDVTGDGLDDLVVPTVPWDAAAQRESSHDGLTPTPNSAPLSDRWDRVQSPVVAYSEDNNDISNDPIQQQQLT
jgi:hypothetical protein